MPLHIPGHEHYVSAHELKAGELFVRLASDFYAGEDCGSYEIRANRVQNADKIYAYLSRAKEANQYLYAVERDGQVVLADEDGDKVVIEGSTVDCRHDVWNRTESIYALAQARNQYEQEYEHARNASSKVERVRELVSEQLRRIEIKASSHESRSPAGVLYTQQAQFLQRLLAATEA